MRGPALALALASTTAACSPAWEPPTPCPTLPACDSTEHSNASVEYFETLLAGETRDAAWADAKEQEIATQYPMAEHEPVGTIEIANVECRTTACEVTIRYRVDQSGEGWVSGLLWAVGGHMTRNEPCEFFVPVGTVVEESCGIFDQTVFVRCDR